MPFHKAKKVGVVKFDASERRDFVRGFTTKKKKKVDKKKQARERHKKEVLEQRQERRKARAAENPTVDDIEIPEVHEKQRVSVFTSASAADPFGDVTVTTTTWE